MSEEHMTNTPMLRKSLLHRWHANAGAVFAERQGCLQVDSYRSNGQGQVSKLGLSDLSTHPRAGVKGRGAVEWMNAQGIAVPEQPNQAVTMNDGTLVARLSFEEHLFLSSPPFMSQKLTSAKSALFNGAATIAPGAYSLPRQDSHAWLFLSGELAATMLSYLCAVNLKPDAFADGQVAQTSIARLNGIVIRQDIGTTLGFHLLCDTPSVEYWWTALLDAALPLGGRAMGVNELMELTGQS